MTGPRNAPLREGVKANLPTGHSFRQGRPNAGCHACAMADSAVGVAESVLIGLAKRASRQREPSPATITAITKAKAEVANLRTTQTEHRAACPTWAERVA